MLEFTRIHEQCVRSKMWDLSKCNQVHVTRAYKFAMLRSPNTVDVHASGLHIYTSLCERLGNLHRSVNCYFKP